ncbi:MAG TPA: methyltransferase domain-containing protein [Isosphaeraceae bacterium]
MRPMTGVLIAGTAIGVGLLVPWSGVGRTSARAAEAEVGRTDGVEVREPIVLAQKADDSQSGPKRPDVIYVPTPQEVVERMLELADIQKGDVLYDLGCGDGRIVVTAAKKYGVKAIGIDIDPKRIREANENVRKNDVGDLVTIRQADIFQTDLREANVVTLYLLPSLNVRLMPQLEKLKPGSRIVSHSFDMRGAKPARVEHVSTRLGGDRTIYLWVVPWEKEER